ncbi:MAG: GNAT family N-acetyltransferase [Candidatus Cloacimonetes bacterium]|nr:GNAT family N-acetyltransferase [Candidatus Cloacimonadota bacterium]
MYKFNNIENVSFDDLATTWNSAFSDYIVPMKMNSEDIEVYFKVTGVDRTHSYGAFYQDTLVGLLINSVDTFRGEKVAYDAMTGIVPEHRGKKLFSQLFEFTKNSLTESYIKHYYLEVITTNEKAYSIYKKKGGRVDREFTFLESNNSNSPLKYETTDPSEKKEVSVMSLSEYLLTSSMKTELAIYEPSFANRISALNRNIDNYQIAFAGADKEKSAVIFNKQGVIPQILWISKESNDSLFAVFKYLSGQFEKLRISNIPITETQLIENLLIFGFKVLVNQYEMSIKL